VSGFANVMGVSGLAKIKELSEFLKYSVGEIAVAETGIP